MLYRRGARVRRRDLFDGQVEASTHALECPPLDGFEWCIEACRVPDELLETEAWCKPEAVVGEGDFSSNTDQLVDEEFALALQKHALARPEDRHIWRSLVILSDERQEAIVNANRPST